jgi:hypothetical protein
VNDARWARVVIRSRFTVFGLPRDARCLPKQAENRKPITENGSLDQASEGAP